MIETVRCLDEHKKICKKELENEGYASANYWIRHAPVTAAQLRSAARKGLINAVNFVVVTVWENRGKPYETTTTTWYYKRDQVDQIAQANLAGMR